MNKEFNLEFIKKKRLEKKLSMQYMAQQLGFKNASTYMKYEKGIYNFRAEHLPILSKEFSCKIENFFSKNVVKSATNKQKEQEVC